MLVRARHDPAVNQGFPATWHDLLAVIGRAQYDVPPLWPRRAPAWLQVGNMVQYADWQFALGLDDTPGASLVRTPVTVVFGALGALGAVAQRRASRRAFEGLAALMLCASLGVVGILNLRAGPSYGWGIVAQGALHEARERDYFFALAFACWGLWAGIGIAQFARRLGPGARLAMVALALVPVAANWPATSRRRTPDAQLPGVLGLATLAAAPANAVLLLAGDNDSYAVWWAQHVRGVRRDVTPVTVPLLPATWYRAEMRRRWGLMDSSVVSRWSGTDLTLEAVAQGARRTGRPVAVGVGVSRRERELLGSGWIFGGLVYVESSEAATRVDAGLAARSAAAVVGYAHGELRGEARDATSRYVLALLRCPAAVVAGDTLGGPARSRLLERTCNY